MIPEILFWAGTVMAVVNGLASWANQNPGELGVHLFPFALLTAAAVAQYLGYSRGLRRVH